MHEDLLSMDVSSLAELNRETEKLSLEIKSETFFPWVKKYTPNSIEDLILPESIRKPINYALQTNGFGHYIFYSGKPGTGKTSLAELIPKVFDVEYVIFKFAKQSVEVIEQIEDFARNKIFDGKPRFVILDEGDRVTTGNVWNLLQSLIESSTSTTRFIITCNNLHMIPEAVRSRCFPINFATIDNKEDEVKMKKHLMNRLYEIAVIECKGKENVDIETIKSIAKTYYPDIRVTLNAMQYLFLQNEGKIIGTFRDVVGDHCGEVFNRLSKGSDDIRKYVTENITDHNALIIPLGRHIIDKIPDNKKHKLSLLIGEYNYRAATPAVDPEVNLNAFLASIAILLGS